MKPILSVVLLVMSLGIGSTATAQSGRDIALKSEQVLFAFSGMTAAVEMTLFSGQKATGQRKMSLTMLEQGGNNTDFGLLEIAQPSSLQGTKLLSWTAPSSAEQQWLQTNRSNKPRRIANRGRNARFVNSTYSFADLLKWRVDSYTYSAPSKSSCPAGQCTKVTATPTDRNSQYGRIDLYYDSRLRPSMIEYYAKGDSQVWKRQTVESYTRVGNSWQPKAAVMQDLTSGESTRMRWSNYSQSQGFSSSRFDPNAL